MKYLLQNKKLGLIFIVTNILVLITIIGIYTYRLVYYYKLDNPKVDTKNLVELLTLEKNIVSGGNGLYKIDNKYIYKGEVENNYVRYSGLLFQVYEINDNEIKMISYDNLMVLEKDINFNNTIKKLDTVIDTLRNKEEYLNEIEYCYLKECNNYYISLLTKEEYDNSYGKNSFLNNKTNYWLLDDTYSDNLMIRNDGEVILNNSEYSTLRITISLKRDTNILSGNGLIDNPYVIDINNNKLLSSKSLGEYVKYNDKLYRIIEKEKDIKLLGEYILDAKCNLNEAKNYKLPGLNTLFITTFDDILLNSYTSEDIYIYKDFSYYIDKIDSKHNVREIISLSNDLTVTGMGTKNNPYIIEGEI